MKKLILSALFISALITSSTVTAIQPVQPISVVPVLTSHIQLNMYASAAADYLTLKITNYKDPLTFELYDFSGKQIMSKRIEDRQASIYINDLQAGNYTARLTETDGHVAASQGLVIR